MAKLETIIVMTMYRVFWTPNKELIRLCIE